MLSEVRMARIVEAIGRYRVGAVSCVEAAELLGISERHFRRLRDRHEHEGAEGLIDRRRGKASGRRAPVDTIEWTVKNSHRKDVVMDTALDRSQRPQAKTLLPRDELPVAKWNSNPFEVDGGSGGRAEDDGAAFLLPYWLGRYHRFLVGE